MSTHVFKFQYDGAPDWKENVGFTGAAVRLFERIGHNPIKIARDLENEKPENAPEILLCYLASLSKLFRESPSSLKLYGAADLQAYGEILVVMEEVARIRKDIETLASERCGLGKGTIIYDFGDAFLVKTIDRIANTLKNRTGQLRIDREAPTRRQILGLFTSLNNLVEAVEVYADEVNFYLRDEEIDKLLKPWKK